MTRAPEEANPYVGLRPFESRDSLFFFGRNEQTSELLSRLGESHFLAVVGGSGCGKSSLIRAGLIPALLGGFLVEQRDRWLIAPMRPGDDPPGNLARALCDGGEPASAGGDAEALLEAMEAEHVQAVIEHVGARLGDDTNLLLLVDQFEEIFAFRGLEERERLERLDPERSQELAWRRAVAADFVDLIIRLGARTDLPIYTVLTMRTGFLGDCDLFYGLPEAMNRGRYLVPRLTREQLRQAIEGPARLSGAEIAPRLLDLLLNQLGDRTDRLPVLQHALRRTWDQWARDSDVGPIDLLHYEAAGTLSDALSMHADEAIREEDLEATARIFKTLTDTDASFRKRRRPAAMSELESVTGLDREEVEAILRRFEEGGRHFVYLSEEGEGGDLRVDICHESLIRGWPRLRQWVTEEQESRDRFIELVRGGRREQAGRAGLLRNPELQLALDWQRTAQPTAAWAERYARKKDDFEVAIDYLERSRQAEEAATRRAQRNRRRLIAATVAVILALTALTIYAFLSRQQAMRQAVVAAAGELLSKDPTSAALILRELDRPDLVDYAAPRMLEVLNGPLARAWLKGHQKGLVAAAFSPGGSLVVTGSSDGTARIWESDSGEPVAGPLTHEDQILSASFDGAGDLVVTTSRDRTARLWQAATGSSAGTLSGHDGWVMGASFDSLGGRLVTASEDFTARIWDVGQARLLRQLSHGGPVLSAVYGPNERVLTASGDGAARLWDARSGELLARLGHRDISEIASFSPDGGLLLTASDDTALVWDATGAVTARLRHAAQVTAARFSSAGDRVLTASRDGTARIWSAATGLQLEELRGHDGAVMDAAFGPSGDRVVTGSEDRTVRVWNASSGTVLALLRGHEDTVTRVAFAPSPGRWVVSASADNTARIWETGADTVLGGHRGSVRSAAFDPQGERVVTASNSGEVWIWGLAPRVGPLRLEGHVGSVESARFSPDGRRVVTASLDGTARIWDADSGELVMTLAHGDDVLSAVFDGGGERVVTGSADGTARVWSAQPGASPILLEGHEGWVVSARFSPDGRQVATASYDETARIWDARSGASLGVLEGHENWLGSVVYSPDGDLLLTASDDDTARLWRVADGEEIALLRHADDVAAASFSADGRLVVTASRDRTARIWDARSGAELGVLEGHESAVTAAAFSPDGRRVVTGSSDSSVRIWDVASGRELAWLQGHQDSVTRVAFQRDGKRVVTASDDGTARLWIASTSGFREVIDSRVKACLDAEIRLRYLGESQSEAAAGLRDCRRRQARAG